MKKVWAFSAIAVIIFFIGRFIKSELDSSLDSPDEEVHSI